jgi:hypothetical protein
VVLHVLDNVLEHWQNPFLNARAVARKTYELDAVVRSRPTTERVTPRDLAIEHWRDELFSHLTPASKKVVRNDWLR